MSENAHSGTILLVDDSATDAELCMDTLQQHKLANHLVWVKDGAEATLNVIAATVIRTCTVTKR